MYWVAALSPGGDRIYNVCLVIVDSARDPKFTSALWTNLHKHLGKKLSFSKAYHPQTNELAQRMTQNHEKSIKRFCAYGLELEDSDGFTHDWCKTLAMLEKGWNPKLPVYTLKKYLVDIHPTFSRFELLLDRLRHHENQAIRNAFEYAKQKCDKSHKRPEFKVGDLIV
ncbi:hypothetical protein O181_020727 [Austropuccinia psidii MF-1]|uniref:Integrase catalytic domain-containing protein n=1 Tax=Austropuccinia psidii MF-1 TaxID=1389203 RepID=A0A9Q3CC65_9BASI|nr:hypothetical protein [Austropuccinia psidii MF-1]